MSNLKTRTPEMSPTDACVEVTASGVTSADAKKAAYAEIGVMMATWAQVLVARSAERIEAFKAEEATLFRVSYGNRSRAQQERKSD